MAWFDAGDVLAQASVSRSQLLYQSSTPSITATDTGQWMGVEVAATIARFLIGIIRGRRNCTVFPNRLSGYQKEQKMSKPEYAKQKLFKTTKGIATMMMTADNSLE